MAAFQQKSFWRLQKKKKKRKDKNLKIYSDIQCLGFW